MQPSDQCSRCNHIWASRFAKRVGKRKAIKRREFAVIISVRPVRGVIDCLTAAVCLDWRPIALRIASEKKIFKSKNPKINGTAAKMAFESYAAGSSVHSLRSTRDKTPIATHTPDTSTCIQTLNNAFQIAKTFFFFLLS